MKTKLIILSLLFALNCIEAFGEKIKREEVETIAINAYKIHLKNENEPKIRSVLTNSSSDDPEYYIVNFDESFIIIAGDDIIPPVLGYCSNNEFSFENVNPGLQYLLNLYEMELKELKKSKSR